MIDIATAISLAILLAAAALAVFRMVRGGSLPDRIVALDTLLVVIVMGLAVLATRTGRDTFLDAMVVAALLGFTGTSLIARFVERRGP
ncbi:MAG: monovalent cation/H+ antiporter complex subunit F [Actinomycetota bacterium]